MFKKISPKHINLIYDALLYCFNRKEALKRFLRSSGISADFIAQLDNKDTKRVWLDRLFPLLTQSEKGTSALLEMAKVLAGMKSFPDLTGFEDSADKVQKAEQAVKALADAIGVDEEKARAEKTTQDNRRKSEEKRRDSARAQADLAKLKERMHALAMRIGTQVAGYEFETWFYDLLEFEDIECRKPYKVDGRQIDGSLTLDGTTYLVELKFEREQSGAPDIDTLKSKVESKADNTMGIMVAMSGYSSVAISDASGRRTALLLLDSAHIFMVLDGISTMEEVIRRVRRHSSQTGKAYLAVNEFGG